MNGHWEAHVDFKFIHSAKEAALGDFQIESFNRNFLSASIAVIQTA